MLYVGNTTQLGEDEIKLIQSIADAFSTAYARYEDFNKLEAANVKTGGKHMVDKLQRRRNWCNQKKWLRWVSSLQALHMRYKTH